MDEVTFPRTKKKRPIIPVSKTTTRSITFKKPRTQSAFEEEKKEEVQER